MKDYNKKQDKVKAALVTILVHAAIIILLAFLTISANKPDKDKEDGVPVLLGMVEDAGGEDLGGLPAEASAESAEEEAQTPPEAEEVPVAPPPTPKTEPKPASTSKPAPAKPLITQDNEKSIAAEKAKKEAEEKARKKAAEDAAKKKADEEARKKAAEEAAKKRAAEEAARKKAAEEAAKKRAAEEAARKKAEADRQAAAAAAARVNGRFGSGQTGSSGNTQGKGAQGSPTGNSNIGATSGVGGVGAGYEGDRTALNKPQAVYPNDLQDEGNIVVSINIDADGNVTSATIINSQTSSAYLKNSALTAAKKWKFAKSTHSDTGKITFKFFHKK